MVGVMARRVVRVRAIVQACTAAEAVDTVVPVEMAAALQVVRRTVRWLSQWTWAAVVGAGIFVLAVLEVAQFD